MKKKTPTMVWVGLCVVGLQLAYYLGDNESNPQTQGQPINLGKSKVVINKEAARAKYKPTATGIIKTQKTNVELPKYLRDYSEYHDRMKKRGRTEEQISRDYVREIEKHVKSTSTVVVEEIDIEDLELPEGL